MAIPKRLLIHNCIVQHITGTDRNGEETYTETKLDHVRIDTVKGYIQTNPGQTQSDRLVLFIDRLNSSPEGFVPKLLDKIIFNGDIYSIKSVSPKFARSTEPHHYEVELI